MSSYISQKGTKPKTAIKLIILTGLPGSGKSTFSKLIKTSVLNVSVINQDELGRKKCEEIFLQEIKQSDVTILDRVNHLAEDRRSWIESSLLSTRQCICVHLATDQSLCIERAKARTNHPTIKQGGGQRIIQDLGKKFEVPDKNEGYSEVVTLYDEDDVRNYLKLWMCSEISIEQENNPNKIHKFPRTQHLLNLGGATRDDLIVSKHQLKTYFSSGDSVDICEKVDGAQMGFSFDENYSIRVQNRSHYINAKSHKQFKDLDRWISKHSNDLYTVLEDSNHILFGEWLYAKHSCTYNSLPNYFLAFDLYNIEEKRFYDRRTLDSRLEGTGIVPVRLIRSCESGEIQFDAKLLEKMLEEVSAYGNERIEGVYVKVNRGGWVKERSKVVREDFICGNEHWSKGMITPNTLTNYHF